MAQQWKDEPIAVVALIVVLTIVLFIMALLGGMGSKIGENLDRDDWGGCFSELLFGLFVCFIFASIIIGVIWIM